MQYNVLKDAVWEVNTTSGIGNKSVDFNKVYYLLDFGDAPILTLSGIDKFTVDFDFGNRIHLDRFQYKFVASNASNFAVASGIKFFYKNESFESYTSTNTLVDNNIFYTVGSGSIFAPRYVRMSHTLSDTYGIPTASGSAYGFQALNNDTIVNFGIDSYQTTDSIETAKGSAPVIKEISIYNSGTTLADAFINLEPQYSAIDDVIYISTSVEGPWIKALDSTGLISDSTNFGYGYASNVNYTNNQLRITGIDDSNSNYASMFTEGYYITRIFEKESSYCRFVLDKFIKGGKIKVDTTDVVETALIRSSNMLPKVFSVIRTLVNYTVGTTASYFGFKDYWLTSQSVKETSSWYFLSCTYYDSWKDYKIVYDQVTERWAGYATHNGTSSYGTAELYIFNNVGTSVAKTYRISYQSTAATPMNFSWREIKLDITGGMWVYFYCQSYHTGDFVHSSGYFLAYFDANLNNLFKWYTIQEEIGNLDVDYNTKDIWYTRPSMEAIYRVTNVGNVEVNFVDENVTYNLGGIAVMPDNGLLFANSKDLHRLKYNGVYLAEYLIEDVVETRIDYIVLDGDGSEAIWTIEGFTVGRLYISGENRGKYDFRLTLSYPVRMVAVDGGVWVHCADVDGQGGVVMRFISKENRRVEVEFRPSYNSSPGIIYQNYSHPNYVNKMPLTIDTTWTNLEWKKISIDGFLSSEDRYYQLKLILRRQEPIERYPSFVTDINQNFFCNDDFTQTTIDPKPLLWSTWLNYPSTNLVYVNNSTQKLVLYPYPSGGINSYINTSNRMLVSRDMNGELDIRFHYTVGTGDAFTNKAEYLYMYLYGVTSGYTGKYLGVYLYLPSSSTSWSYIYGGYTGNFARNNFTYSNVTVYDGEIRIYWNGSTVYGQWGDVRGSYTSSASTNCTSAMAGDYFYVQFIGSRDGSQITIDNFEVYKGYTYYYTESPAINSIYKQELLEVKDIYPNNYKNIYMKTYVPKDLNIDPTYDVDMKVRWRVPVY